MMLCCSIPVVSPSVNLDFLLGRFVGCGKCVLFPFAEITGFSNENEVYVVKNKNQKTCMEK